MSLRSLGIDFQTLEIPRRKVDLTKFKTLGATKAHFSNLITKSTLITENNDLKIAYIELGDFKDFEKLRNVIEFLPTNQDTRTNGLVVNSRIFGLMPRIVIRNDFCSRADMASKQPVIHNELTEAAATLSKFYEAANPFLFETHRKMTAQKVLPYYQLPGGVFTSGIVNKNSALNYHFDSGNYKDVWSVMIVFKRDVDEGYLSVPEYDVGFELKDNSLLMFDGQQILHGVTPIIKKSPEAYRFSMVYYSMRNIWLCEEPKAEAKRVQQRRTLVEERKANGLLKLREEYNLSAPIKYPIFIPSKGRAINQPVSRMLKGMRVPHYLVVEPQDAKLYAKTCAWAKLIVLPKNNGGIAFVRQFILDYARKAEMPYYWQIDDNIKNFLVFIDKQGHNITPNVVLSEIEKLAEQDNSIALAGPDYQQFAAFADEICTANSRTYCCVLTKTDTGIDYDQELAPKEDVDFVVQHLLAGYKTLLVHKFAMAKPTMGNNSVGGNVEIYKANGLLKLREEYNLSAPIKYPIFIPSKGRAINQPVSRMLKGMRVPHYLVVEPQDAKLYAKTCAWAKLIVLPKNNGGIAFVRQFILDYARKAEMPYYWQIDDNIKNFLVFIDKQGHNITPNVVLSEIEKLAEQDNSIALAGPDYQQFAAFADEICTANSRTYCCVLTKTDTGIDYDQELAPKEDVDFVVQHLLAGYKTLLVHKFAMAKPTMGNNSVGGNVEIYKAGKAELAARAINKKYPDISSLIKKDRSLDVRINWGKFR